MSEPRAHRVRASDAEREQVAARLRAAIEEGRLTLDEGEQRLTTAYAVTYRDELPELTADLPAAEPPSDPGTGQPHTGRSRRSWSGARPPRPAVGVFGLLLVGVLVAGLWAAAGGALWPVIVLGVLAVLVAKHGWRRARSCPGGAPARMQQQPYQSTFDRW